MTDEIPWLSYEHSRPQQDLPIIIECRGRERNYEIVLVPRDLPPEFNVANLRWRPTGIFRELGGTITECGAQMQNALGMGSGFCGGFLASLGAGCSASLGAVQLSREEYGPYDYYLGEKRKWV
jgi:hypothetical protein